jgi:3-hydroxybutyrate dehydrogenase
MSLKGKAALVTGSTSGIGLGIARILAAAGADVALNGFGEAAEIETLRRGLEAEHGVHVVFAPADIADPDACARMVADTRRRLGSLDILVNNAGIQATHPIEAFPVERWNQVLAVDLSGAFYAMRVALPAMREAGWGRVVNIASAHGLVASAQKAAYVAAKHGLLGLTKVAAIEYANTGVTVNAVCPGWVLTPLVERQIADRAAANGTGPEEETRRLLSEKQPMLRFSTPEQIGAAVLYLCSDGAATVTGTHLPVDGGWTAQ